LISRTAGMSPIADATAELSSKKTVVAGLGKLKDLVDGTVGTAGEEALIAGAKRGFTVLQTRFSSAKFWRAGLDLFVELDCALQDNHAAKGEVAKWVQAAMDEVDEEQRDRIRAEREARRVVEERKHCQGAFADARTMATQAELAMAEGVMLVEDDERPAASRDARANLPAVKIMEAETCAVCLGDMLVGQIAKQMPCGHTFHDDCLLSWLETSNSCPMCRYDELPSEKRITLDDHRRVAAQRLESKGIHA